jgi:hypothetical protein
VPIIRLGNLSEAQKRALILADNRIAEKAGWDFEVLAIELAALIEMDFDMTLTGFEMATSTKSCPRRRSPPLKAQVRRTSLSRRWPRRFRNLATSGVSVGTCFCAAMRSIQNPMKR